jgi:tetratricopeptide (TPR) repeat protein/predicted aspartyl protease
MTIRSILLALSATMLAALGEPAAAKCSLRGVNLPVTMVGPRAVVAVKLNGVDVKLFIDSGSFTNILNPETAQRIGLHTEAYDQTVGATGASNMRLATVREFDIAGVPIPNTQFRVSEHALGGADGLIGEQLLAKFDIEYDLANGVMRLFPPADCGWTNLAYWSGGTADFIQIQPLGASNTNAGADGKRPFRDIALGNLSNLIVGPVSINGVKIQAIFDTGAPRSTMTLSAARSAGVRTDGPGVVAAGASSGVGARTLDTWLAPFDSFAIGDETVKGTKLLVADYQINADMLLGADFFLSHHIFVARSQNRLYFTYNGGPVFNLEQAVAGPQPSPSGAAGSAPTPTTAAEFSRRAAASVARHEYEPAIADYTQAIALAPTDAQSFYDRGVARIMNHQPVVAMGDLDEALKLKPDNTAALMLRGELRLQSKDEAGAQADFAAALKLDPSVSLRVGGAYARAGHYQTAILDFDSWISTHPRNEDLAGALSERCRARVMLGAELDKALADCDDALRYRPGAAGDLAQRGLAKLRLGQLDAAISDFDAAIHLQPKEPWALYGRGVAELREGDKDKGAADLAAAAAADPHLADRATKAGITP